MTVNGKEIDLSCKEGPIDYQVDIHQRIEKLRDVKVRHPGILWHYTSVNVLELFLKGEIALSHYKFMNDDDELEYGYKILKKIAAGQNDKMLIDVGNEKPYGSQLRGDAFLFCLSRDGDSLYQWRSYTPKGGVSIAFDKVELFSCVLKEVIADPKKVANIERLKLIECRYDDVVAEKFLNQLKVRINNSKKKGLCNECRNRGLYVSAVIRTLLMHKNPSFVNEQEERLLLQGDLRSQIEFIAGKPRIVLRNPDIAKAIKAVRLSPHGDVKRNRLMVEMMRDKYGLSFDIDQSKSSYNGM